jgi:hypothetical protein
MKKFVTILSVLLLVVFSQQSFAQVFADFENPADSLQGFFDAGWFGPMSQFERIDDPTGRSAGVVACGLDRDLHDRGVVQSFTRVYNDAGLASFHIYLPADFPDSALISIYGVPQSNNWGWFATDIYGVDIPNETWWPIYYEMQRLGTTMPDLFSWADNDTLAHFGIQFFLGDIEYAGTVLIDDAAFLPEESFADFENPADSLQGFFDAGWFGPMSQFERIDDPTERSAGVVACGLDRDLHDRGVVQSFGRVYGDAGLASFRIYLPADFPDSALISIYGVPQSNNWGWFASDIYGVDIPNETWWPIYYEMERIGTTIPDLFSWADNDTLAHFGIQFFLGDIQYSGTVLIDDAAFTVTDDVTAISLDEGVILPEESKLWANYPNPFNPSTTISFDLKTLSKVQLVIYDVTGKKVKTLYQGLKPAGNHQFSWNGTNDYGQKVSSGLYFYSLIGDNFVQTRKMVLMK